MSSQDSLAPRDRANQIGEWIKLNIAKVAESMPLHVRPEKVSRVFLTELSRTPALLECTRSSLLGCFLQASALGLELGGPLGQAYPVPFRNRRTGQSECTLIIGYKGLIDLVHRSGLVATVSSYAVREGDTFDFQLGSDPWVKHKPTRNNSSSPIICAYAVIRMSGGDVKIDVMYDDEIAKIRSCSRGKNSQAWVEHYDEMARKTVLRRACKTLPTSTDRASEALREAIAIDEKADANIPQEIDIDVLDEGVANAEEAT